MPASDSRSSKIGSRMRQYALAIVSVGAAVVVAHLLQGVLDVEPLFFAAVMLSAWFGGKGPGLLAVFLSALAIAYYFLTPIHSFSVSSELLPRLAAFIFSAVLVAWLSTARKRAEVSLRRAHDEMESQVRARTEELRRANEALREQASLLNLTHDTIFVRDMNDVITYWNRGAEELYDWKKEEAIGRVTHQLMQTVFPEPLEEINKELLRTGRWAGELIHARRDGTRVVVASRWALQRDGQGRPIAILETNNDITERKQAEQRLRRYFELPLAGMAITSVDRRFVEVNQKLCDIVGYRPEELTGMSWVDVTHPDDVAENVRLSEETLAGKTEGYTMDKRFIHRDGHPVYTSISSRCVRSADGAVDHFVLIVQDLTARKLAEDRLRETQAQLAHMTRVTTMGELAASIAHEINQPLCAVVTNANASLRYLGAAKPNLEEVREGLACIVQDGTRASDVIGRIRALLKRTAPQTELVDINDLIREISPLVRGEARKEGVSAILDLSHGLPGVEGDRVQLQQVILNLVLNGIEAMAAVDRSSERVDDPIRAPRGRSVSRCARHRYRNRL